jgi:hypothetical protein
VVQPQHLGGKGRGGGLDPGLNPQAVEAVVGLGDLGDHAEILFIVGPVVQGGDIVQGPFVETGDTFTGAHVAFQGHLVQAGGHEIDHVEVVDDLFVFPPGHAAGHKDPQMADLFMDHVDNDLSLSFDLVGGAVHPGDPVEGLLGRGDVVAPGGEDQDGALDVFQAEPLPRTQFQDPFLQFVAHEEAVDDEMDLFAREQEEAAPPFLELQIAFLFRVHRGKDVVLLRPVGVGRVEGLKVGHQIRPVEDAVTQVAQEFIDPDPPQEPSPVAHGILPGHPAPVGQGRPVEDQGPGDIGPFGAQKGRGPSRLAVSDDGGTVGVGMELGHLLQEAGHGRLDIGQVLAGKGLGKEEDEIDGMAEVEGHADLGIHFRSADPRPVTGPGIDDDNGTLGLVHPAAKETAAEAFVQKGLVLPAPFGDPHQGVIDRTLEMFGVEDNLEVEGQHRRLTAADVTDIVVAPLAQDVREEEGPLPDIHGVLADLTLPCKP